MYRKVVLSGVPVRRCRMSARVEVPPQLPPPENQAARDAVQNPAEDGV
ncbi:MAG: hypothetical protein HC915_13960 [Anaerolineae bacterium]|nr:hypothetical protein [Anaerolineae bacterium]